MNSNNMVFNTKNYADIQGLASLKGKINGSSKQVSNEVAQQFESMMMQMMLNSMRSANAAFTDKENHSDAFDMYQELFDKQASLSVSGLGIAKQIEAYLARITPTEDEGSVTPLSEASAKPLTTSSFPATPSSPKIKTEEHHDFSDSLDFVKRLLPFAQSAAGKLGLHPGVLLAQAALETNWGKQIIAHAENGSTYNLFNIKADPSWKKDKAVISAVEDKGGVLTKEKSAFRKYSSFSESFQDYVNLIQTSARYAPARAHAGNPEQYLQSLQRANYATDQRYGDKVMEIFNSKHFKDLIKSSEMT